MLQSMGRKELDMTEQLNKFFTNSSFARIPQNHKNNFYNHLWLLKSFHSTVS